MLKKVNLNKGLELLAFLILSSLIFIIFVQVFTRRFFETIPIWSGEETANLLLMWLVAIGAGIAAARNSHLAMNYVVEKMPERFQKSIHVLIYGVICIFLAIVAVVSIDLAWGGRFSTTSRLNLSMFWFQISIFIGALIMFFYYIKHFVSTIMRKTNINDEK